MSRNLLFAIGGEKLLENLVLTIRMCGSVKRKWTIEVSLEGFFLFLYIVNFLYCMQGCANDVTLPGRTKCFEWHLKNRPRCQYVPMYVSGSQV